MKAYQWDEQGYFVREIDIDPSGEIPERTTFSSPGTAEGHWRWMNGAWENTPNPPPAVERDWIPLIAAKRYAQEIKGFPWGNFYIDTERDSQSKIASSAAAAEKKLRKEGSVFKMYDLTAGKVVSRPTSNAEMIEIGDLAFLYVQACYDREGELMGLVDAGEMTDAALDEGWP